MFREKVKSSEKPNEREKINYFRRQIAQAIKSGEQLQMTAIGWTCEYLCEIKTSFENTIAYGPRWVRIEKVWGTKSRGTFPLKV